ncbi:hypothetical protein OHA01_20095 [Micromonospora zamorensis]|uniref:hypothetical protein n=1 Tax=Micromonospora zamorensis TaxID=709883 RepID=UPI0038640545|nr:hypothetical protein OHA01_20095 [Micromonospora zamorensis]
MGDPDSARALRPLRRLTLPGGRTLLRAGLVAVLLGLAAAILHTPTSCPPTAEPSRAPTGADGTAGRFDEGGPTDPGGAGSTGDSDTAGPPPTGAAAGDSSTTGSGTAGDGSTGREGSTGRDGTTTGSGRTSPLPLPSGAVGVPVRLAEPAALAVARPGTRVDLLAATPGGAGTEATLLAPAVLVLDVLGADATDGSSAL